MSLIVVIATSGCSKQNHHRDQGLTITETDGLVHAVGSWTAKENDSAIPDSNSVTIDCWRDKGECVEAIAIEVDGRQLSPVVTHFRIVEWETGVRVRAVAEPRAADLEINIAIREGTVDRVSRETSERGAMTDLPKTELWTMR